MNTVAAHTTTESPRFDGTPPATAHPSGGTRVELRSVVKDYAGKRGAPGHRALAGVSLALEPGEFVALLGPSGCGKTTALRSLAGLETITSGSILLDGADVATLAANRRDMGMVFQSYSLFPHMTVQTNVEFGLRMRGVRAEERRQRAAESLQLVGLGHLGERYAHQLSGGQQQRVALARALVTRPRVLLLDEPLSALDAQVRVQLRDEIKRIQRELGITTVFVTHDQEEALAVADRVAVMREGMIEQIGTPEQLYSTPASPFVAEFIGLTNRVSACVVGGRVQVNGQDWEVLGTPVNDGPVTAFVRPEDIAFDSTGIAATVAVSSFLGSIRRTLVRLGDGTPLTVQHDVTFAPQSGDIVAVRFLGRPVVVSPTESAA